MTRPNVADGTAKKSTVAKIKTGTLSTHVATATISSQNLCTSCGGAMLMREP